MDEKIPENTTTTEIHTNIRGSRKLAELDKHLNHRDEMDSNDHGSVWD